MDTPERIWLQDMGDQITWCDYDVTNDGVEYVKAERIAELEQQLGETNEALAACQSEAGGLLAENERLKSPDLRIVYGYDAGFKAGMERAAEIVKSRLTNNDAKPYYEVWNSALYGAETAIRAELEPVTRPEER
jgi:hypothetical protein